MRVLVAAIVWMGLAGCSGTLLDRASDLERTWDNGVAVRPGGHGAPAIVERVGSRGFSQWRAAQERGSAWPVIVYLHGCTGLGQFQFFRRLAHAGYVVVAPDSMARRYRPLQCDPKTRTSGYNLFVYDFRRAEISYAVQRLAAMPWVDSSNLFLIGTSEGGVATALYRGDEFRARVITQWTCVGRSIVRGIDGPLSLEAQVTLTKKACLSGLHPHPLGLEWAQTGYRGARHGCSRPRRSPIPAFATRVPATFPR